LAKLWLSIVDMPRRYKVLRVGSLSMGCKECLISNYNRLTHSNISSSQVRSICHILFFLYSCSILMSVVNLWSLSLPHLSSRRWSYLALMDKFLIQWRSRWLFGRCTGALRAKVELRCVACALFRTCVGRLGLCRRAHVLSTKCLLDLYLLSLDLSRYLWLGLNSLSTASYELLAIHEVRSKLLGAWLHCLLLWIV